jgi:hypothetical protein
MGLFYSNMTVHGAPRQEILALLRRKEEQAFVSPEVNGHTVVFERLMDEQKSGIDRHVWMPPNE